MLYNIAFVSMIQQSESAMIVWKCVKVLVAQSCPTIIYITQIGRIRSLVFTKGHKELDPTEWLNWTEVFN